MPFLHGHKERAGPREHALFGKHYAWRSFILGDNVDKLRARSKEDGLVDDFIRFVVEGSVSQKTGDVGAHCAGFVALEDLKEARIVHQPIQEEGLACAHGSKHRDEVHRRSAQLLNVIVGILVDDELDGRRRGIDLEPLAAPSRGGSRRDRRHGGQARRRMLGRGGLGETVWCVVWVRGGLVRMPEVGRGWVGQGQVGPGARSEREACACLEEECMGRRA